MQFYAWQCLASHSIEFFEVLNKQNIYSLNQREDLFIVWYPWLKYLLQVIDTWCLAWYPDITFENKCACANSWQNATLKTEIVLFPSTGATDKTFSALSATGNNEIKFSH